MSKKNIVRSQAKTATAAPLDAGLRAELDALRARPEDAIDTSDIPPLDEAFWRNAVRNPFYKPVKAQLTVRIDADILAWLRAAGSGYQTKLNAILRQAMVSDVTKGRP